MNECEENDIINKGIEWRKERKRKKENDRLNEEMNVKKEVE